MGAERALRVDIALARRGGFELDVAFEVPPGVTVLLGPSGAGKSTTLAAIAGLVRPARGRITLGEATLFDAAAGVDAPVHARRVGLVFQSLALFPHMTALDNVAYGMSRGSPGSQRRAAARLLLDRLRVAHVADRRPCTLSGGEAQRVAVARALASQPRVVLLDEPFSALDAPLRAELRAEVAEHLRALGVPVLFVTHDLAEATTMGARVVVLERGRVARQGPIDASP